MMTKLRPKRKRKSLYPWDRWFRQKQFTLERGLDYSGLSHGMAQQVRNRMHAYGVTEVSIHIEENRIVVTVERRDAKASEGNSRAHTKGRNATEVRSDRD